MHKAVNVDKRIGWNVVFVVTSSQHQRIQIWFGCHLAVGWGCGPRCPVRGWRGPVVFGTVEVVIVVVERATTARRLRRQVEMAPPPITTPAQAGEDHQDHNEPKVPHVPEAEMVKGSKRWLHISWGVQSTTLTPTTHLRRCAENSIIAKLSCYLQNRSKQKSTKNGVAPSHGSFGSGSRE